jgi:hypothetical protein
MHTYLEAIRDAEFAATTAAAAAEAEASAVEAASKMEATKVSAAEVVATDAAKTTTKLAVPAKAAAVTKAASTAAAVKTKATLAATATGANTAEAVAATPKRAVMSKATNPNNNNTAQQTGAAHPSQTAVGVAEAGAGTTNERLPTPSSGTMGPRDPIQEEDQQQDTVDWDLTDEDALP